MNAAGIEVLMPGPFYDEAFGFNFIFEAYGMFKEEDPELVNLLFPNGDIFDASHPDTIAYFAFF